MLCLGSPGAERECKDLGDPQQEKSLLKKTQYCKCRTLEYPSYPLDNKLVIPARIHPLHPLYQSSCVFFIPFLHFLCFFRPRWLVEIMQITRARRPNARAKTPKMIQVRPEEEEVVTRGGVMGVGVGVVRIGEEVDMFGLKWWI